MRSVLAAVLLPVVAVLVIGPYTFLPSILKYAVAHDVQSRLGLEKAPKVNLKSDPPLDMLSGKFDGGDIVLKDAGLGGVRTENAVIDLDPFDVDVLKSVSKGSVVAHEPLSGRLRVEVPEAEVSRLVGESAGVPVRGVAVTAAGMEVRSKASVLGTSFSVSATGDLRLAGESFVFVPQDLEAAGIDVPQGLADAMLEGSKFDYPIKGLPYDSRITGVDTVERKLVLTGRVPRIMLGIYPGG